MDVNMLREISPVASDIAFSLHRTIFFIIPFSRFAFVVPFENQRRPSLDQSFLLAICDIPLLSINNLSPAPSKVSIGIVCEPEQSFEVPMYPTPPVLV